MLHGLFINRFDVINDLVDLTNKVVLITGGNTGIGYGTVKHLARKGAKVYMAARNEIKAANAIAKLKEEGLGPGNGEVIWFKLDLSDPRDAKKVAQEFMNIEKRLDILINNAAIGALDPNEIKTCDGIAVGMIINYFSPFVFTQALLPLLKETAKEPNSDVRIIVVASAGHRFLGSSVQFKDIEDFNVTYDKSFWPAARRYFASKLADILWALELQKRLDAENANIIVLALHPGVVCTYGDRLSPFMRQLAVSLLPGTNEGAYTSAFAAASPKVRAEVELYKGAYFEPVGKVVQPSKAAKDPALAAELWATTEKILSDIGVLPL